MTIIPSPQNYTHHKNSRDVTTPPTSPPQAQPTAAKPIWAALLTLCVIMLGANMAVNCTSNPPKPKIHTCSAEHPECPQGYVCVNDLCIEEGSQSDMGTDRDLSAPTDSSTGDGQTLPDGAIDATTDAGLCKDGEKQACYTGPEGTLDVGICTAGKQVCTDGVWGSCDGELTPEPYDTCGNNLDDNCDGFVDDKDPNCPKYTFYEDGNPLSTKEACCKPEGFVAQP